ncbi:hypothetical protein [Ruegeria profundi]|uniref:Uncharacterized protein n=1 Tax=Ruegeria profundi TaxID=1685378 RepID=A0A0X3TBX5_9RHOB|nr:hypothetical protein [Ruegeria profundi]KUJ73292.1 hypothetical protein AVO44_20185 [Ruegeria profundi]
MRQIIDIRNRDRTGVRSELGALTNCADASSPKQASDSPSPVATGTRLILLGRETRLAGEISAEFEAADPIVWISEE